MKRTGRFLRVLPLLFAVSLGACATQGARNAAPPAETHARIGVLETTDIHTNILSYDYYKLAEDKNLGLERAATLIRAARKEFENSMTFDSGDTIQGTVLADYQALIARVPCDAELGVYKAMDAIGYDAGTIGNHEFNYGLEFLSQVTGTPFAIDWRRAQAVQRPALPARAVERARREERRADLHAMAHPRSQDQGAHPRRQAARGRVARRRDRLHADRHHGLGPPQPRRQGHRDGHRGGRAEIRPRDAQGRRRYRHRARPRRTRSVALHDPYRERRLASGGRAGIDAMLLGHSHAIFPNPGDTKSRYAHMPEVDNERGFVRGVPR